VAVGKRVIIRPVVLRRGGRPGEVNVELHALDAALGGAPVGEAVAVEVQLREPIFELAEIHAEIEQRTDEHVSAQAAEHIEVKGFHGRRER